MQQEPEILSLESLSSAARIRLIHRLVRSRTLPKSREVSYAPRSEQMPGALREFYQVLPDPFPTLGEQNRLLTPRELAVEDGKLRFAVENQYVYTWATEIDGEDPPVFGRFETDEPWQPEGMSLSLFLVQFFLFELMMSAPFGASVASISQPALAAVLSELEPIQAPPWRWPAYPSRFFLRGAVIAVVCPNGDEESSLWLGAESPGDVSFVARYIDPTWDYVNLGDQPRPAR